MKRNYEVGLPEKKSVKHGKCREMRINISKLKIGEKTSAEYKIAKDNKSALSRRIGIKICIRKNGDYADIYRVL